jgi:hypothetical protein
MQSETESTGRTAMSRQALSKDMGFGEYLAVIVRTAWDEPRGRQPTNTSAIA